MKTRLYVAGIFGGVAALLVTVLVVFAFGRSNPSPPSLEKQPNPAIQGELLYVNADSCFVQASASGATRTMRACLAQFSGSPQVYWLANDTAAILRFDSRGSVLWEVDLNTGAEHDTGRVIAADYWKPGPGGIGGGNYAPDGTYAVAEQDGDLFVIEKGVRTRIASFDVPEYNQPSVMGWSPDLQWILLTYYPRRADGPEMWIVSRDGNTRGTIAKDFASGGNAAWRMDGLATQPPPP